MFGKARDINDSDTLDSSALDEFFGDEAAAENTVEIHDLRDRVVQVESQINSQFTSLATYAQIAQEQVELARSEAKAATERSEQRLTSLVERERADRITSYTGVAPDGSPDLSSRLDALEHSVARIQKGLDECRQQQKDLAVAITSMFDRLTASAAAATPEALSAPVTEPAPFAAPPIGAPVTEYAVDAGGPISGLALNG
jgi:predicted  nucleic acid-binding Zn-ribbon protein